MAEQVATPEVVAATPAATAPATAAAPAPTPAPAAAAATSRPKPKRVNVVYPEGANSPIVPFENSPEWGYIQLKTVTTSIGTQWARPDKRSCTIKGTVEALQEALREHMDPTTKTIPGVLLIREFTQSELELPEYAEYKSRLPENEALEDMREVKRAGEGGPMLKVGEEVIFRFTDFVHAPTPEDTDRLVQHDNQAELQAYRAANPGS